METDGSDERGRGGIDPRFIAAGLIALALVAIGVLALRSRATARPIALVQVAAPIEVATGVNTAAPVARTLEPYEGLGTWLDAFDFSPAYGVSLSMGDTVDAMAQAGVETIFVQSGRIDERSPDVLEDRWVLAELLLRAHQHDMAVVAWFLPMWGDDRTDLSHLVAAHDFNVLGERFDGVALDIEWTQDDLEVAQRNQRLVTLSREFDDISGDDPVGAIVLPPVLLEVVNDQFWPEFPWAEMAPHYDVWLPMSYWSGRSNESGYGDGYNYSFESIARLRANIGQPNAPVHGIGGIGGTAGERDFSAGEVIAAIDDVALFTQSLVDSRATGGSIYDWMTLDQPSRDLLAAAFSTGVAANLPPAG